MYDFGLMGWVYIVGQVVVNCAQCNICLDADNIGMAAYIWTLIYMTKELCYSADISTVVVQEE